MTRSFTKLKAWAIFDKQGEFIEAYDYKEVAKIMNEYWKGKIKEVMVVY
jgi:hypothetical protein